MIRSHDNLQRLDTFELRKEIEIIAAARAGSLDAFDEIVRRYQSTIRACLAIRLNHPHDAEDLAQDTFIIAFKKLSTFDTGLPLGPWLRGIALNLLRNYHKKNRPFAVGAETELVGLIDAQVSDRFSSDQEASIFTTLEDCMEKLDPSARHLLHRRYYEDAAVQDIAKESQRNHSTVTMQLHRLRAALADCIRSFSHPVT